MGDYETRLTPDQEQQYQTWRASLPKNLQNESDYDLRGAFLASVEADGRLHMTDRFKKPNHITFSDGSQYSTPQAPGGQWMSTGQPNALLGGNSFVFWASPENQRHYSMNALADYFRRNEPGNSVIFQSDYKLPKGR